MKDGINHGMHYIGKLCDEYVHIGYAKPHMKEKRLVQLAGYGPEPNINRADESQMKRIRFYMWGVFVYTYLLDDKEMSVRREFLWRSLLLPYIYKVNINSPATVNKEIKELLDKYPIIDGKDSEKRTKDFLINKDPIQTFYSVVNKGGRSDLLPSRDAVNIAREESCGGWKILKLYT